MSISRRIGEYRPAVILFVLMVLSLASLASGMRATVLSRGVNVVVSVVSYPFLKTMTAVGQAATYTVGLVVQYNATLQENVDLRRQVGAALTHTVDRSELLAENARLRGLLSFQRAQPRLSLLPVQAIAGLEGSLSIDRGSLHGIRVGMYAMTPNGVVGWVTEALPFVSSVATLQKADFKMGAMIRRNRVRGVVHGSGSTLSTICTLRYIDIKDDVRPGDEVVTSPESRFPSGYPVGTVIAVHDEGALLKTAEIQPAANPYRLDELFIVLKGDPETAELAGEASVQTGSPAPSLNSQSLQERYAP